MAGETKHGRAKDTVLKQNIRYCPALAERSFLLGLSLTTSLLKTLDSNHTHYFYKTK